MSRKPSQGSRMSSPRDEERRTTSEDSNTTLVPQRSSVDIVRQPASRRLTFDSTLTTASIDDDEDYNDDDEQQANGEEVLQQQMPIILLDAQSTVIKRDAQVGTVSQRTGTEHSIGASGNENRPSSWKSSNSDPYDLDEPLTTKVVKVFKKRHRIQPAHPYDSDDSVEKQVTFAKDTNSPERMLNSLESDLPMSDTSQTVLRTEISSGDLSSSGSVLLYTSETTDPNNPQANHPQGYKLASGMAFIYMSIPPDGGYGWLVLVLSFLAQLIVDGIVFSIGILLPYISEEFNVSSAQVILVGSIQIGCYFMGGAFSSALINSYGFRPVALLGVIISAASILLASFCPNLPLMIIFYSIIGGPGLSMIWVSSQLIIGYYFERYRPIASGFSCSGAGAGIFLFSIANSLLVVKFGWRNTIRFQVILILLITFMALAYLEVAPTPVGFLHNDHLTTSSSNEYYGNFYVHNFLVDDVSSRRSHAVLENYEPPQQQGRCRRWASRCLPCFRKKPVRGQHHRHAQSEDERSERNYVVRADPMQREDLFYTGPADYTTPHSVEQFEGKELELVGSQAHLQRIAYGLHNIHDYDSTDDSVVLPDSDGTSQAGASSPAPTPTSHTQGQRHKKPRKDKKRGWVRTKAMKAMNRLFDMHLLRTFEFRVLLTSAFLYPMGFNIPFVYSKERTTIPLKYAQWIGPAIGATSFLMRIVCGFVAYKLRNWTNYICGGGMMLGGIMVFVSAFYGSDLVWFQFAYGLLYGVAPAVFATLRALIYVRYLGLSKLTNAFGITALAMGLGVFIGTTFGGLLVSKTGGYVAPFAFAGLCITISGLLKLILPTWIRYREYRKRI
ncbi:uncharacterized protein LOC117566752 [Drosophila albomicans]|uniref:Uncharacterized protein LOC117566752 n=1 Tax=Drosophila albomicans TaxID=7291 RepID=A0A6P8XXV4_DROAB|nr:uncharacterized protein LOC117566752 [Drosophila albomicans]